jgi:hypothetical protein
MEESGLECATEGCLAIESRDGAFPPFKLDGGLDGIFEGGLVDSFSSSSGMTSARPLTAACNRSSVVGACRYGEKGRL